ncbi:HD domain-containing protein [Enterobacter kobei]|uniref:HD domain-containing protein n=1 Tax=Enterobacter kobei TaxID=208224 RepID=UPI0004A0D7B5|nr:ATP-binding protein [Enterobacter kobei]KDF44672.1 hypothetical protein AE42_01350 [Enterobacter kobei]
MSNFKETSIWKAAFQSQQAKEHESSVNKLINVFEQTRENSRILVSEISVDLPNYTVHDITHLDALWEIGSQIVGSQFCLNPVEGFILGCSFLFHDSAMTLAAYPNGLAEIKSSREWKRLHSRIKASHEHTLDEANVLEIFLREQHAIRAEKLPKISWESDAGSRYLIDDADTRERFGEFIGQVAASHWWDHSKLDNHLHNKVIPAPAPFPSSWSVDLLKLACVLRAADAAQIDERRAPGFLHALRQNRLSEYSKLHWTFQNKLTQAQNRSDTLYFAALRPFSKSEAKEWWLLHDTLKMIDKELRKTDDLLARRRGNECRFAARRVANIESAESLKTCIQTDGWHPVDTAFSISDIPKLIANLGGNQLYGHDNIAALREIIQNAMDSIRIRSIVDPQANNPLVEIELSKEGEHYILKIRDNGVGMSESSIVENLLSFGKSGWLTDDAIGEYNDNFPHKNNVSGRYGIGFFSIFMLTSKVEIKSRRFDASPDQTSILFFPDGLNTRPLLCGAEYMERMTAGGTEIKIHLNKETFENHQWNSNNIINNLDDPDVFANILIDNISKHFPTSNVPVKITHNSNVNIIDGSNWESEPASFLLKRVEGNAYPGDVGQPYETALSLITEPTGEVVGRAFLCPDRLTGRHRFEETVTGSVVSQGARLCSGSFRGVLIGSSIRASRDAANILASSKALQQWATEQARLLHSIIKDDEDQVSIAEQVASIGGDIGELKFCEIGGKYFNRDELCSFLKEKNEIWVAFNSGVSLDCPKDKKSLRTEECISVNCGIRSLIYTPIWAHSASRFKDGVELEDIAIKLICEEFAIKKEVSDKMCLIENGHNVYSAPSPSWRCEDGSIIYTDGSYFKRNMILSDIDAFFIPENERE